VRLGRRASARGVSAAPAQAECGLRAVVGARALGLEGAVRPAGGDAGLPAPAPAARDAVARRVPGQHGARLPAGPRPELLPAPRRAPGAPRPRPLMRAPPLGRRP